MDEPAFTELIESVRDSRTRLCRLRGRLASVAEWVAQVEAEVAATYEARASTCPGRSAELLAHAAQSRRVAAHEQRVAERYRHEDLSDVIDARSGASTWPRSCEGRAGSR